MHRLFLTTAWTGSNTPFEHALPNGETARVYQTLLQAYNDADTEGDIIQPAPPGTPGFCFYDASGEPLQTVCVNLGANWTMDKSITLQGDWTRLRIDGVGAYYVEISGATITDVDFVRLYKSWESPLVVKANMTAHFSRCMVAGCGSAHASYNAAIVAANATAEFADCAFVANKGGGSFNPMSGATINSTRCVFYPPRSQTHAEVDCISFYGLTQEQVNAIGFVKPPKVYDASNPGYYTDGTAWSMDDWENVDWRLLSTSQYASGGTSVTSGQKVYDLAGMPRKVGGARGAYECLSDVNLYAQKYKPGVKYTVEYDGDAAPRVLSCCRYDNTQTVITFDAATSAKRFRDDTDWVDFPVNHNGLRYNGLTARWKVTNSSGEYARITIYEPTDEAPQNALTGAFAITCARSYKTANGSAAGEGWLTNPTTYVGYNTVYASTGASVGKVYVGNGARVKLGDAIIGELVIGLRSVVKTTGKVTIKNETATSAEILSQLKPTAPAEVTFKECAISDSASE